MKAVQLAVLSLLFLISSSFITLKWQYPFYFNCTPNILEQVFPDQNACRLYNEIPHELKFLSYAIYPLSKGYDTARFNFNKRFNIFPHAIFTPRDEEEVVYVLSILKKHHLPFSIRSGGHCIEPGSLSSGYVIDLRNFNKITPNFECQEAFIGAGCLLGSVIETLGRCGYAIPTGSCTSVGIAGQALGGGIGILDRPFGLTCDLVKSILMIDAEGRLLTINKKSHPDLFWALRGGGNGSYGIVLGFTSKTQFVPIVTYDKSSWDWGPTIVQEVFDRFQEWIVTLPDSISSSLEMEYRDHQLMFYIDGLKVGPEEFTEWKSAFASLNPKVTTKRETYLESTRFWTDRDPFPFLKYKSEMLFELLTEAPVQLAIDFFEKIKKEKRSWLVSFALGALGGKVADKHTAFFPRKAFAWWHQKIFWDKQKQDAAALAKLSEFYEAITPYVSPFAYANLVDYELGSGYLEAYYGDNVDELIRIKNKYDPKNLFRWRQSIPLHR